MLKLRLDTKYFGIYLPGAPPRWLFDCPLDESNFIPSPGVGTYISEGMAKYQLIDSPSRLENSR